MLPVIFLVPVVQLVILVHAATLEMKSIDMVVVDQDLSPVSRKLVGKFIGSPFFAVIQGIFSTEEAEEMLRRDQADVILQIPPHFERDLVKEGKANVMFMVNAINGAVAGLIYAYSNSILYEYNQSVVAELSPVTDGITPGNIQLSTSFWYNPELNYKVYMLPGILVILVTLIGMFLTAINLVREKEIGTIEQINVTPIKKYQFIVGKLVPFWVLALIELGIGLTVGRIFFHIPIVGNVFLLFGFASVYLLAVMGIGLFLSAVSSTQQQVMFLAFFFMITFILMSGIFTSVESMPHWAQVVNIFNPFAYFMRVIRMVVLKGSGFHDIRMEFGSMFVYACVILSLAVWRYRKVA
jgi:ABC-2 type transport system permease protein